MKLPPGLSSLGRSDSNAIVLPFDSVSGCHCQLEWTGETVKIRDLGSTNGCFIHGQRVEDAVWPPGAPLLLGSVPIQLEMDSTTPAQVTPATSMAATFASGAPSPAIVVETAPAPATPARLSLSRATHQPTPSAHRPMRQPVRVPPPCPTGPLPPLPCGLWRPFMRRHPPPS